MMKFFCFFCFFCFPFGNLSFARLISNYYQSFCLNEAEPHQHAFLFPLSVKFYCKPLDSLMYFNVMGFPLHPPPRAVTPSILPILQQDNAA